ncbi:hypothetical protein [Arsukibacterium indicum]|uniref:DUF1240 domain-containing protein n=1 Tax=Arsukibacterium indicum TaxID=2848612 RepID=A0ABS6MKM7_9GAMM|nr:hypothetical protein [Arsukibacterium indicum]MBV2129376.1 hypothetical protein [Arsukibacterium indicum]
MNQQSIFKDIIALFFFGILLIACTWTLLYSLQTQLAEISSIKPLIVLSSFHGYLPGALLALVFMLGYAANRLWRALRQQRLSADNGKITAIGVLAGLGLAFIGSFVINAYWDSRAEYAGYQPCPSLTLLTNRVTMQAWTKNEALCFDNDVRRIIVRGTADETAQVAQHLNAREKQRDAKMQFLQKENELKQRKASAKGS